MLYVTIPRPILKRIAKKHLALIVTDVDKFAQVGATAALDFARMHTHWLTGGLLTVLFAGIARWVRGVNTTGAMAGALSCFILYIGGGPGALAALVTVFGLAWITTRIGYRRKQQLGTAERREGRSASQVLANLGVATACAALVLIYRDRSMLLLSSAAALSEAAADTVSSEVGQAFSDKAWLITNLRAVPAGSNGGVSGWGTLAGIAAAAIVSAVYVLAGGAPRQWLKISVTAAVFGMIADSFLGAWFERPRLLNNNAVNFLGTLVAAISAAFLS